MPPFCSHSFIVQSHSLSNFPIQLKIDQLATQRTSLLADMETVLSEKAEQQRLRALLEQERDALSEDLARAHANESEEKRALSEEVAELRRKLEEKEEKEREGEKERRMEEESELQKQREALSQEKEELDRMTQVSFGKWGLGELQIGECD